MTIFNLWYFFESENTEADVRLFRRINATASSILLLGQRTAQHHIDMI